MTLQEAINHPRVNVFDIAIGQKIKTIKVQTYRKPGESESDFQNRCIKNIEFAERLINKKPD